MLVLFYQNSMLPDNIEFILPKDNHFQAPTSYVPVILLKSDRILGWDIRIKGGEIVYLR